MSAMQKVTSAVGVSAGSGLSSIYLTLGGGQVAVRVGSGWRSLGPGTSVTIPT